MGSCFFNKWSVWSYGFASRPEVPIKKIRYSKYLLVETMSPLKTDREPWNFVTL